MLNMLNLKDKNIQLVMVFFCKKLTIFIHVIACITYCTTLTNDCKRW